jgi:hypothetical protein
VDAETAPTSTLVELPAEGLRLATTAAEQDLPLRVIGGVAFHLRCPSAHLAPLARSYGDVDFVGLSDARREITDFFEANGYVQDRMFNALHGAQRLNFTDPVRGRYVDVILDEFAMCHTIDFRERLLLEALTVPLTELLLSKLQVVELNPKDVQDLLALLLDHGIDDRPGDCIESGRLCEILGDDWGFEHTVRRNLAKVAELADDYDLEAERVERVRARIAAVIRRLDETPKSMRWRLRARLGERVRWYDLPEEGRR